MRLALALPDQLAAPCIASHGPRFPNPRMKHNLQFGRKNCALWPLKLASAMLMTEAMAQREQCLALLVSLIRSQLKAASAPDIALVSIALGIVERSLCHRDASQQGWPVDLQVRLTKPTCKCGWSHRDLCSIRMLVKAHSEADSRIGKSGELSAVV